MIMLKRFGRRGARGGSVLAAGLFRSVECSRPIPGGAQVRAQGAVCDAT